MSTKIEVTRETHGLAGKKPTYLIELIEKFKIWSEIDDPEIDEAIKYLSSDLYTEIRKCESRVYTYIDNWPALENKENTEEIKDFIKAQVREMWRDMVEKQKIGIDKLGILVRRHISIDNFLEQKHGQEKKDKKDSRRK